MRRPNHNTELVPIEYFISNPDFAQEVIRDYNHAKEMNASWYGPKISFLISKPKLLDNAYTAKKSLKQDKGINPEYVLKAT